jgi:hypothetical protein
MPNIQSQYQEVRLPFNAMSFTPDIPSTNLGPNEYNAGINVEADLRGLKSTFGDVDILNNVPGTPTYLTGGFRQDNQFWFLVAVTEGKWYASNGTIAWYDITPGGATYSGYTQFSNITSVWNGTVCVINDTINAPMWFPDSESATLILYSNAITPALIDATLGITYVSPTEQLINLDSGSYFATPPYLAGQSIVITGTNTYYNGTYTVVSSTTSTITYLANPASAYSAGSNPTVSPAYTWNYNPNWSSVTAGWLRMYSTPNVGSILVAGNLTTTDVGTGKITNYPATVQWSQAFGLNQVPLTWVPTITNVANQLEVPARGPTVDAFPSNGNFFLCSYWDTVIFSPINYATTTAPILGVSLYNQGRGLLSSGCWAASDNYVYGVDARDVWKFDGQTFTGLATQRVKTWFFDQVNPIYYNRVFMQINTQKNSIEIYYPDSNAINGVPNMMLSYRISLDCWNAPRQVDNATMSCESPIFTNSGSTYYPNIGTRTVVYARGLTNQQLAQKDYGYQWANGAPIYSEFRRDNIKLLKDYSGKLMVHRLLPEVINLGAIPFTEYNNQPIIPSPGSINVQIEGSDSVGSLPSETTAQTMQLNTSDPWVQIDQNVHRVNSLVLSNTSGNNIWMCSAVTMQFTQTEDDR